MEKKRKRHFKTGARLIRDTPILSLSDDEEEEIKLCMKEEEKDTLIKSKNLHTKIENSSLPSNSDEKIIEEEQIENEDLKKELVKEETDILEKNKRKNKLIRKQKLAKALLKG